MWRSCTFKRRYKHEGQARREAFKRGQRAYACSLCGNYHLTKMPGRQPGEKKPS